MKEQDQHNLSEGVRILCPYGNPGDRLWVREEHFQFGHWEPIEGVRTKKGRQKWRFVADSEEVGYNDNPPAAFRKGRHHKDSATPAWHKRLARFMPRKFSRITLEITGIRVERLQDITADDARAEGVTDYLITLTGDFQTGKYLPKGKYNLPVGEKPSADEIAIANYAALWESINGPGSWDANPFVWVIEFKKLAEGGQP